jgi:hypothetical protein
MNRAPLNSTILHPAYHAPAVSCPRKEKTEYHCASLVFTPELNCDDFCAFFNIMINGLALKLNKENGAIRVQHDLLAHKLIITDICYKILTIFVNSIVPFEELKAFAPSINAYKAELAESSYATRKNIPIQLEGYNSFLQAYITTVQPFIGLPPVQLLYRYYGFPMSETLGCFIIDFALWHIIKPEQLCKFRKARDNIFDCNPKDLKQIYNTTLSDTFEVEKGFYTNFARAFNVMLQHITLQKSFTIEDIISWHDLAAGFLKKDTFNNVADKNRTGYHLSKYNSTPVGLKLLRRKWLTTKSGIQVADKGYHKPTYCPEKVDMRSAIVSGGISNLDKFKAFMNTEIAKLVTLFNDPRHDEKQKLLALIDFVQFIDVHHLFRDGNIRTCLLIFYYFHIRYRLPLTILSDPNIFDGYAPYEIHDDILKGRERYKLLCLGRLAELKRSSKECYDRETHAA